LQYRLRSTDDEASLDIESTPSVLDKVSPHGTPEYRQALQDRILVNDAKIN
jgi:hypothetical protein